MTVNPVPEPTSWLLLAVGGIGIGLLRWRRRQRSSVLVRE